MEQPMVLSRFENRYYISRFMNVLFKAAALIGLSNMLCLNYMCAQAQSTPVAEVWVANYNGPSGLYDQALDMTLDPQGNILVTGYSTSISGADYTTIKYDTNGNQLWVTRYDGPAHAHDAARAIVSDSLGNVYVTGESRSEISGLDFATIKYDGNGNELWVARYNGPGNNQDWSTAIAIDSTGNVYVTGKSWGTNTGFDYATVKYDANGHELWTAHYNGTGNGEDEARAIAIDSTGNVYVTGKSWGGESDFDYATIKYDTKGNELWVARFNGLLNAYDGAVAVAVDGIGNVYVGGTGYMISTGWGRGDYVAVKYDGNGHQIWRSYFNRPLSSGTDTCRDMVIDDAGNVYMTGSSWSYTGTHLDYATVKFDTNGTLLWSVYYDPGKRDNDCATALTVDAAGNVYVTGETNNPDPALKNFTTIKYAANGARIWVKDYFGPEITMDIPTAIAVDSKGDVFVSGYSGRGSAYPEVYSTVKYSENPPNQRPVAQAGVDQTAHIGTLVTLNGSGSYDPDGHYPLSFDWAIIYKPIGSLTVIAEQGVTTSFRADVIGDYIVSLVVTDALNSSSFPDEIVVSTYNSAPVADAGPDLAVIQIGSIVELDGGSSWDDDGDPLSFEWTLISRPHGSLAHIFDPTSPVASFCADVHGDFILALVVRDPWISSNPDYVVVSFNNLRPVADAGGNQSVFQGETVYLDGTSSYDSNLDTLTFAWSFVSKPTGSVCQIEAPNDAHAIFVPDLPGEYVVSLIVDDGHEASDPSNITIVALSYQSAITTKLQKCITIINLIAGDQFKNVQNKNALTNKFNTVLRMIDDGRYEEALDKLENDILQKTDGCSETGHPDRNDWITDCDSQREVYPVVLETIELVFNLL